ncbi:hypothetical protein PENSTE_c006G03810 [Penicillium steckii]|uniref:penicillopepsin n=1 Tax=Penicillium steckii TaxID=303698 RepID=A0A1V6TG19_9EURO|nr:hypothetical protein PENSTE_c006G03810 [Penicillium steckii]
MSPSKSLLIGAIGLLASVEASTIPNSRSNQHKSGYTSSLIATQFGMVFDAPVTIGNQSFQLLVDTGSSDTYVMQDGFTCIDSTENMVIPQDECLYSNKTYHKSRSHRHVPGEMFGIEYGAGIASGEMAYEDVSLNGLSVKGQKVAIANVSTPMGDKGVNSGLLGLAYPALSSAHPANHTNNETYWYDRMAYDPVLFTMQQNGLIDPYFSLALARTPQNASRGFGGYLTLGGLPPVKHSSKFSSVPVKILDSIPKNITSGLHARAYWASTVSSVSYGPSSGGKLKTNSTSFKFFLDSGNYIQYLPSAIANPINDLFDPPAKYVEGYEGFVVDCSAKTPKFGLTLGNQTFFHNGRDLIYQTDDGTCISNIAPSESVPLLKQLDINILGVPFLKNVVAVFDFGENEMRFAKRLESNMTTSGSSGSSGSATPTPSFSSGTKSIQKISWIETVLASAVFAAGTMVF